MLNNIIVDKLRIALPLGDIVNEIVRSNPNNDERMSREDINIELGRIKNKIDSALKMYLPSAFVTSFRHSYFRIEFNPTRYRSKEYNDDVNLQMIPEEIFLRIFQEIKNICPIIIEKANVVELNLTKNLLLNEEVFNYTDMLLNIKTAHGIHPISICSKGSKSVYFSSLKRDFSEKDYIGNRLIKFYDKTYELKYVKGKNLTRLKLREKLTEVNKNKLGARYSEKDDTINLEGANLLRVELTYVHGKQISKIAKNISDESEIKLSVPLLMERLNQKKLYKHFDDYFEEELKKFIFHERIIQNINTETEAEAGAKEQKYTQILPTLQLGRDFNLESAVYYFWNLLETAGLNSNTVRDKLTKINTGIVNNELYIELYKALFLDETIIPKDINFDLYWQIQRIDEKNREDGRIILSDEFDEDDYFSDMDDV